MDMERVLNLLVFIIECIIIISLYLKLSLIADSCDDFGLSAKQLINLFLNFLDVSIDVNFFYDHTHVNGVLGSVRIVLHIECAFASFGKNAPEIWVRVLLMIFFLTLPGDISIYIIIILLERALNNILVLSRLRLSLLARWSFVESILQSILTVSFPLRGHQRLSVSVTSFSLQVLPVAHPFYPISLPRINALKVCWRDRLVHDAIGLLVHFTRISYNSGLV